MKSIVFVTVAPNDTLGDVSAASKLIHELLSQHKQLQIHWYVLRIKSPSLEIAQFKPAERCEATVIDHWDEILTNDVHKTVFKHSNQIVAFPTFHWLSTSIKNFIYSVDVPFIAITEYDYDFELPEVTDSTTHKTAPIVLHSGLGEKRLGIFIDPPSTIPTALDADADDFPFISLLLNAQNLQGYLQSHQLFFGYFNSEQSSVDKVCCVNQIEFIKSAVLKARKQDPNKPHVDVIVRWDNLNSHEITKALQEEHLLEEDTKIEFWHKVNGKMVKASPDLDITVHDNDKITRTDSKTVLRIINPFRLGSRTFTSVLHASDPFCALTGDQSFSEGIYKFFFYQTMKWKKDLFTSYLATVEKVLGSDSLLYRFYNMQHSIRRNSLFSSFKELMGDNPADVFSELKKQAEVVAHYILKQKNLRSNLPAKLLQFLVDPVNAATDCIISYKDLFALIKYFPKQHLNLKKIYHNHLKHDNLSINYFSKNPSESYLNKINFDEINLGKTTYFSNFFNINLYKIKKHESNQSTKRLSKHLRLT